jgi:hypothetical protein
MSVAARVHSTSCSWIHIEVPPKLISMGDSDMTLLFGGAFVVIALGGAATFWFLLR